MMQVNILEAKMDLAKLIRILELKKEDSITVERNGKPIVKMTWIDEPQISKRIGSAKGKFKAPNDFDAANDEAAEILMGGSL